MEGSDDFSGDDIWSPSLREELFSDFNLGESWDPNANNDLFLPRLSLLSSNALERPDPPQQHWGGITRTPTSVNLQDTAAHPRKRSHLDPPNFPLATDPTGTSSNSSGRPPPSVTHLPQPSTSTPPRAQEGRHPPPSAPDTGLSDSETSFTGSDRSVTPWPESDEDSLNLDDFIDLTQDSSPPTMPPARQPVSRRPRTPQHRPTLRSSVSVSRHLSEADSNPAKRRKTGTQTSQSSQRSSHRSKEVEGIDLTGVDDDRGLSKVLEQQRIATVKAQQEQASKPVRLSTLQCIICMDNMKNVTATSCGKSSLLGRQACQLI